MVQEFRLNEIVKEEESRKIFAKVFDRHTIQIIHSLAVKGVIDVVEFVVSTGKEAHVFRAMDRAGNFLAVKVYKIETSDFKHMEKYLLGDRRFKNLGSRKKDIVFAWTKKEFKNLAIAAKAGVNVPLPLAYLNNVLVMSFIGENGKAALTLKDRGTKDLDLNELFEWFVDSTAKLYKAGLVHADLSEYNVLIQGKKPVLIDIGQAVLLNHPKAKEFFERDVKNIASFFSKNGLKKGFEEVYEAIKTRKE